METRAKYPYGLQYSQTSVVMVNGSAFASITAKLFGNQLGVVFSVSPPLPRGLTLNADGSITGSPQALAPTTSHVIRAELSNGAASTAAIFLTVTSADGVAPTTSVMPWTVGTSPAPPSSSNQPLTTTASAPQKDSLTSLLIAVAGGCLVLCLILIFCTLSCMMCKRTKNISERRTTVPPPRRAAPPPSRAPLASNVPARVDDIDVNMVHPSDNAATDSTTRNLAIEQMLEMGYSYDAALLALEQSNWDVARATERVR
jgi:hypothetical protein